MMAQQTLAASAHVDTFTRDNLPPAATWPEFRFDLPELRYPRRLNCADALLDHWADSGAGERRCLLTPEGEAWSYSDLRATANRVANVLVRELGVVPGNRVLLRGPNNPWLVACWFGAVKAGAVVVATMPLLRSRELSTIAEIAAVDHALCDSRFTEDLKAAGVSALTYGEDSELSHLADGMPSTFENVATSADDVCLLAFTSGTTGKPKATMHFHRDVLAIADTFSRRVLRPKADDVFTGTPPLAFTFGLGALLVFPMSVGASTLLVERSTPDLLLELVARHGVTTLFTAPTAYRAMVSGVRDVDLRRLHSCVSAGETLPEATWTAFNKATGLKIIDGIGSTEMLHIFISAAGDDIRPGATGREVPGYVARVVDEAGQAVPDGELGLLAVQGPTGCRYLRGDRQRNYVREGWNYTGDAYVRDRDGYFWFQARADDMIISSGYNIAGPEVEDALLRHPKVAEAGVVGVPDQERGMVVKAFVVLVSGTVASEETVDELKDFVKSEIAPYKHPRQIEFVPALPRTETGKLQRFKLREG
jgi:2-aminobenzoate-CoA ligase